MMPLEFNCPNVGYAKIIDQFLLGDRPLIAPILTKGAVNRTLVILQLRWKSFDGLIIIGPKTIEVKVPLNYLPYFEKNQYIINTLFYDDYCIVQCTSFKNYCKSKMLIIEPEKYYI